MVKTVKHMPTVATPTVRQKSVYLRVVVVLVFRKLLIDIQTIYKSLLQSDNVKSLQSQILKAISKSKTTF